MYSHIRLSFESMKLDITTKGRVEYGRDLKIQVSGLTTFNVC
jgi:hypothetical protein